MKTIAFFVRHFTERGTEVSVYDYAKYNEEILGNRSIIIYFSNETKNKLHWPTTDATFKKFSDRFESIEINNIYDISAVINSYDISIFYTQTHGMIEKNIYQFSNKELWGTCKTIKHCVFDVNGEESDYYCSISNFLANTKKSGNKIPVLPYIVTLPSSSDNLRSNLNIPEDAIVFGGYGGQYSFDIKYVHKTVFNVVINNPNIYFLFANFDRFCPEHPNIIHLPSIIEPIEKTKFINTCDAMLWARSGGETFGLAIGEFSMNNKPVIATKVGEFAHVELLGDKAMWYSNEKDLYNILTTFNKEDASKKDWNAYKEYNPEKVMTIFKNIVDTLLDGP